VIRIVLFILFVAALALGAAWFADRPGEVVMIWQGWRISTSLTVALAALIALVAVTLLGWSLARLLLRSPGRIGDFLHERRQSRGWQAVSRGLIAVATGNPALSRRYAGEARKLLAQEPLALLLTAQAAQIGGDARGAEAAFRKMLESDETRLLGLRGLFMEARRRADPVAALTFAEQAAISDPALPWAGEALIEFRARAGDWAAALEILERQISAKAVGKREGKRRRAVLTTAQALALEETDRERARELALDAVRLAPDLVPAVAVAARLEAASDNLRRAARMIEKAWAASPHPELAEVYAELRPGDLARERLQRVKKLVQKTLDHPEALLAVTRAALDANDFGEARDALAPLVAEPTRRVCLLMAEIEAKEHGDHGKAREWTARAARARPDPAWVADGFASDRWLPVSPLTGRIDAFVWTVPHAALGGPVLEQVAERARPSPPPDEAVEPEKAVTAESAPLSVTAENAAEPAAEKPRRITQAIVAEPPLPDDPGPDADVETTPLRRTFRLFQWLARPAP
jgi:HemY protein